MVQKVAEKIDYPKARKFAGKRYNLVGAETTKTDANRQVKKWQGKDCLVREVYWKPSKTYLIYARHKRGKVTVKKVERFFAGKGFGLRHF